MIIHLSEIIKEKNSIKEMELPLELRTFLMNGTEYIFAEKNPIKLTFTCLGKRRFFIKGSTSLILVVPCNRCLEDVLVPITVEIEKEIDLNETEEDRVKNLDEINYIEGYNLDVDQMVYNEIFLSFPSKVLCQEECKGICPLCGANRNKKECSCKEIQIDPRMAKLQDIFNNNKEV